MTTIDRPAIGTSPKLDINGNIPGAQIGILLLSIGRLPKVSTPYRTATC